MQKKRFFGELTVVFVKLDASWCTCAVYVATVVISKDLRLSAQNTCTLVCISSSSSSSSSKKKTVQNICTFK